MLELKRSQGTPRSHLRLRAGMGTWHLLLQWRVTSRLLRMRPLLILLSPRNLQTARNPFTLKHLGVR